MNGEIKRSLSRAVSCLLLAGGIGMLRADAPEAGASFLNLGVGASALAMGSAVTSCAQGATAFFWNPGALGWQSGPEFAAMHSEHFQSIRHEHIAFSKSSGSFGYALAFKALYLGGLEERTGPSADPIGTFGAYFLAPALSCAKTMGNNFSAGFTLKTVYEVISDYNTFFPAGDLGLAVRFGEKGPKIGLCATNLGLEPSFNDASFSLPTKIKGGISFAPIDGRITLAFDLIKPLADDLTWCAGCQAAVGKIMKFRAGYRHDLNPNGGLAGLGTGIGLKISDINIDYAVNLYGALGITHSISVAYNFDRSQARRDAQEALIAEELQRRARITAQSFYDQGLAQQRAGRNEDALWSFDIALIWDPQYADAQKSIEELKRSIDTQNFNSRLNQAISDFNKGNYIEALRLFSIALEIDSASVLVKQWIQTTSDALVKLQMEKQNLDQATRKKIAGYMEQGLKYFSLKQFSSAIGEWRKVLAIDSGHREALDYISKAQETIARQVADSYNAADKFINEGKWTQALAAIDRVLALEPGNQAALAKKTKIREMLRTLSVDHTKKGIEFYKQKKFAQAEAEFKIALDYDSLNVTAGTYLKKLSTTAVKTDGADINDLYMKGITAYTKEDFRTAIRYWKKVLEIDPQNANAKRNIARAEEKLKLGKK